LCPAAKATVARLKRSRKSPSENAKSSSQGIAASLRGLPFLHADDIGSTGRVCSAGKFFRGD
jgi:hypothetical protein